MDTTSLGDRMKNYHSESWSQQARSMSNMIINHINQGSWPIERGIAFCRGSYRHFLIRYRAAKRLGCMVRNGKVHENPESIINWRESRIREGFSVY